MFSYSRNGALHFIAIWRFRFSFCMAKETVAQRDARKAKAFTYRDYRDGVGYIVTFKEYGNGTRVQMPGRAMFNGQESLPSIS